MHFARRVITEHQVAVERVADFDIPAQACLRFRQDVHTDRHANIAVLELVVDRAGLRSSWWPLNGPRTAAVLAADITPQVMISDRRAPMRQLGGREENLVT